MAKFLSCFVLPLTVCAVGLLPLGLARAEDLSARASATARERGGGGEPLSSLDGTLKAGEPQRSPLKLKPAQCIVAVAVGAAPLDLDLSLKTRGGTLSDTGAGPIAHVRYCAAQSSERAQVFLRSHAAGEFALGVWTVPAPGSAGTGKAQLPAQPETPISLAQSLRAAATQFAPGLEAMTPPREEDLATGDARERDLPLDADHCYRFLAVAEAPLTGLDLTLQDGSGKQVLAGHGSEGKVVLALDTPFCPDRPARFKLTVTVTGGTGRVIWQAFGTSNASAAGNFPVGGEGDSVAGKRVRDAHQRVGEKKRAVIAYQEGRLQTAQGVESSFEVQPGSCYVAMAAGAPSLRSLDLEIVDQRGNLIAQALDRGNLAHARVCADLRARWTARVRVFKGYGEYGLQVFGGP